MVAWQKETNKNILRVREAALPEEKSGREPEIAAMYGLQRESSNYNNQ